MEIKEGIVELVIGNEGRGSSVSKGKRDEGK